MQLNLHNESGLRGFRLHRLEVLNWGTFNGAIWDIAPSGNNALLTGDIGSGKSTLVDAITTLLVPQRKITYNKAAGAESRERNLKSYVRGAFKNEKVEQSSKARDVYLRSGQEHITVLLGVFSNRGLEGSVTLAQVFWMKDDQVQRFYVLSEDEMSIKADLSDFGSQPSALKRRLKEREHTRIFNSFTDYSNRFRQLFGIQQPEALALFYQTVSMKSVGNLTDFVREQMLGQTNIQQSVYELVKRYRDLTEAYRAVQRAKQQHELLQPLIKRADQLDELHDGIAALNALADEVPVYFAGLLIVALQREMDDCYRQWRTNADEMTTLHTQLTELREDKERQKMALSQLDISRQLERLELQIQRAEEERARRQQASEQYRQLCGHLSELGGNAWQLPQDAQGFNDNLARAVAAREAAANHLHNLKDQEREVQKHIDHHSDQLEEIANELHSLRQRPTQIPQRNLVLRQQLLDELNLTEQQLPFVGELLQVHEQQLSWEGAIERLLHGFGLSLLVENNLYGRISQWVNRNRLRGKLVYLRTLPHRSPRREEPSTHSLVHKIDLKQDSIFQDWLEEELKRHYDYECCEDILSFQRAKRGLTKQGQIKSSRIRHTKDDRHDIHDRRRYVLGWNNQRKIEALEIEQARQQDALNNWDEQRQQLQVRQRDEERQREHLRDLLHITDFQTINLAETVARLTDLNKEKQELENNSDSQQLHQIRERIQVLTDRIQQAEQADGQFKNQQGGLAVQIQYKANGIYERLEKIGAALPDLIVEQDRLQEQVEAIYQTFLALQLPDNEPSAALAALLDKENIKVKADEQALRKVEQDLLQRINGREGLLEQKRRQVARRSHDIIKQMEKFRNQYPEEARDFDAHIQSMPNFRQIFQRLTQDDIPRHRERFRSMLREGAIQGILSFKSKLEDYENDIRGKIDRINRHLRDIDYNDNTYILITSEPVRTEDIKEFKQDLRACLDNIYGEELDIYTEQKFLQVKKLLDRFQGASETDLRWTRRVTDVRQWFTFGADERYRHDDASKEYYSDSAGKSGGQKEKLAYTILASAIAFQFGLEWRQTRDRSFRFVVIDEAFGRGSDDSTRYALRLFERLDLQLLIVTPLQKINIIEDYIRAVHYVSNPQGNASQVRNISKQEYEAEKMAFQAHSSGAAL